MASIWEFLNSLPKRADVSPEELAARRQGYADLYQGGLLARNRDQMPLSVQGAQATQDFLPVIGDALALGEAGGALSRGELAAAGLLGAGAAIGLVPGAGDALAKPVMAAGRRAADIARRIEVDPNALGSMGGNIRLKPQGVEEEITLFHGSPYDFREFDLAQVGKGEGAQDLGRGFSLTDEEIVAHSYMNPASRWGDLAAMERYRQAGPGRTYQVGVKARPDQILDWKKPWKDQVPEGTPLFEKIQESMAKSYADDPEMQKLFQQANLSSAWRDDFGMEDAALQSGFVGNKRQNFSGDTEFTIFDPSKMEIKRVFDNEGRELPLAPASPAQEVAGLLSSGRVDEVTDEMLAKFTPKDEMELFDLYQRGATGMDLPMDEASRMARAVGMGFDVDKTRYHGSELNLSHLDPDMGAGERYRTGIFSTDNPDVADSYVSKSGGTIYPMTTRRNDGGSTINAAGANWNKIPPSAPARIAGSALEQEFPELFGDVSTTAYDVAPSLYDDLFNIGASTNALARQKRFEGDSNITFENLVDRGPNIKRYLGETPEMQRARELSASQPSDVRVDFYGNQIRAPFARFDPRLAHLRNLSAGVGGLGLLSSMMPPEEQY